jgi:hypothetical protein
MQRFPRAYYESKVKLKADVSDNGVSIDVPMPQMPVEDKINLEDPISSVDFSWLPFAAKTYHISPNIEDYVLKVMPICPSDIPNRNGIAFPIQELIKYQPPPISRQVYKAWSGCPVHVEHDNRDCTKAVGVIFDTMLTPIKGYGNGNHWKVMGLFGIDKIKAPEMAEKVLRGEINTGSMGAEADQFTCGVCGAPATDNQFKNCGHITSIKDVNYRIVSHNGEDKLAYLNAHGLSPIEFSLVQDPAWTICLSDTHFNW